VRAIRLDSLDYDGSPGNSDIFMKTDSDHAKMQNESVLCVSETK